jgi:Uri superfamily endonuclease
MYIGSTVRPLHQRVKEHLSTSSSAVHQHLQICNRNIGITTTILANETDPKNLRIKEAILITDRKPNLNRKEEEKYLLSLVKTVI